MSYAIATSLLQTIFGSDEKFKSSIVLETKHIYLLLALPTDMQSYNASKFARIMLLSNANTTSKAALKSRNHQINPLNTHSFKKPEQDSIPTINTPIQPRKGEMVVIC